jgi:hypothetical protein
VVPLPTDAVLSEQTRPASEVPRNAARLALAALIIGASVWIGWNPESSNLAGKEQEAPDTSFQPARRTYDWSLGADDLTDRIQHVQLQAMALEGSLVHPEAAEPDQLAEMIRQLRERTNALEREVAPKLPVSTDRSTYRSAFVPDERK